MRCQFIFHWRPPWFADVHSDSRSKVGQKEGGATKTKEGVLQSAAPHSQTDRTPHRSPHANSWHGDGGGLYLRIREDGAKRWIFVWKRDGRRREMFLGTPDDFTLKEVRDMAAAARHLLQQGFDPLEMRRAAERSMAELRSQVTPTPAKSQSPTFGKFADRYIDTHEDGWKNAKHRWQWRNSITNHCKAIVSKPVDAITTDDVLDVLKPIWRKIPDTAGRVRTRIEKILDAARADNHIAPPWENPARWSGNLEFKLPKRTKLKTGHYSAMEYENLPAFFGLLRERPAPAARALELTILCATRTSETLKMRWREIDLERATWTIPAERMKMGVEHRIPLSSEAVAILKRLARDAKTSRDAYVFPGQKPGQPLSQMSMTMVLRRMNLGQFTVHGMRSSFRDYMGDMTPHAESIVEQALAHQVGDATVRAYRRKDAFEKRRLVMQDWANYLIGNSAETTIHSDRRAADERRRSASDGATLQGTAP